MTDQRIWDISQRIHEGIPMWPGEPPVKVQRNVSIGPDCPVNIGALSLPLHTGTHGDAPLHYDANGIASDQCALDPYIGPCTVVDARHAGASVFEADIDWDTISGATRVLIRTYERFPHEEWDPDFTAIDAGVIARLRDQGVRLIGTDAPSLDPESSKTMDAHHEVRAGDMRILEGLVLDDIAPGRYELIALPLAIAGADASPVRAILRELAL
ncbi:MAG: arylformamidase [Pseudomonadota bacterium]